MSVCTYLLYIHIFAFLTTVGVTHGKIGNICWTVTESQQNFGLFKVCKLKTLANTFYSSKVF